MKKIVLFVFISIILICIGCDLSFLQKKDTLQTTSSQTEQTPDNAQQDTTQPEQGTNKPQPGQNPGNPETGEDTDNSQSSTSQPGQDTDNSQSGTSQPGQNPDNPEKGEDTDDSQSGTSQPGQNPDNPETGEDTDNSQSGTSQPGQNPDNPETGENVDNPQQDQNETTVKSQNTIDFFYTINGRDITLTPVVSWEGVKEDNLKYVWWDNDQPYYEKTPTITASDNYVGVRLYVFNGTQTQENLLSEVSKTISITDSFPTDSTTDTGPKQLFLFANDENHPDMNLDYMYFALQIKGTSSHGTFRTEATKDGQDTYAYPRSVQYEHESSAEDRYTSMYAQATPNLANLGVGYTEATGFSPTADGTSFSMPFYLGDNKCRVKMNGTSTLRYSFANFVVWDTTVDTFLGNWGWPVLIRLPSSEPLIITIPMDQYDSSQHKNIALLTVTLNDNASKTDFKYDVQFDRFVNKNE